MKVISRGHEAISDGQRGSMVLWKQENCYVFVCIQIICRLDAWVL